ncbi:coiled-coil domain-containing protein 154 isoform X2 [Monodelphis domestica]|uniref:coiled-coil domain-containing protein 154 isoform X2 n=1 Tax=Monodelphis domestica TaxID=13616 RepID=UPI0004433FA3|nr:coiled-coil domain-containing protein 154 isoform X2 [Monodelphis domestica]
MKDIKECGSRRIVSGRSHIATMSSSSVTLEDLELFLDDSLKFPESLVPDEISDGCEYSNRGSSIVVPEQDTPKRWKQLEQWVADLQAEVICLRGQKERSDQAVLGLLRELLQIRARIQMQDSELEMIRDEVKLLTRIPEKEACELSSATSQSQMELMEKRLVEVREALVQIRRKQALQDKEKKNFEAELNLKLDKLNGDLKEEAEGRETAFSALQRSQEENACRASRDIAGVQAQALQLGEEMSLKFLKREAKLCGHLQKNFVAIDKKMKVSENTRLKSEKNLWEELEVKWQKIQVLNEDHFRSLKHQQEEESRLLDQCQALDNAVVQLTEFVRQNQTSLNRVLKEEQKNREAQEQYEKESVEKFNTQLQTDISAVMESFDSVQQETRSELDKIQEKSQVLEESIGHLVREVRDLSDHFVALSWKFDLQEQTLNLKMSEAKKEWSEEDKRALEKFIQWQNETIVQLKELQEKVESFLKQVADVNDRCLLQRSDFDQRIITESRVRDREVGLVKQELAAVLSALQLLKEENPSRKIAEIQGKLATFQSQIMKMENNIQDNKTIQNLKFNTETKMPGWPYHHPNLPISLCCSHQRVEEIAHLRENVMKLWSDEGPWALTLGSKKMLMSLVRQRFFIKDVGPDEVTQINRWGLYQAVRWLKWKTILSKLKMKGRPRKYHLRGPAGEAYSSGAYSLA